MAGRRKSKRKIAVKKYSVLLVTVIIFLLGFGGWRVWSSDFVQMRFVYMWPYQQEILEYSDKNKIDPFLIAAIIKNESGFDHKAVSAAGAVGLMQIMPETGRWIAEQMGIDDYTDDALYLSRTNIRMGCWYVGELEHEFKENLTLIMIAYNAGRGQTKQWMQENNWDYNFNRIEEIPFPDTRVYVSKVLQDRDKYYLYYKDKINKN